MEESAPVIDIPYVWYNDDSPSTVDQESPSPETATAPLRIENEILDVGSVDWFLSLTADSLCLVHSATHRRFLYHSHGAEWNDDYGASLVTRFQQAPRSNRGDGRLEVGSPDWLLYFSPNLAAFVHKRTYVRHVFRPGGVFLANTPWVPVRTAPRPRTEMAKSRPVGG